MFFNGLLHRILRGVVVFAMTTSLLLGTIAPPVLAETADGTVLPFPPVPSASTANETLQDSEMIRREEPNYLPDEPPNILIILLDDVGFGQAEAFGGEIKAPTIQRLWDEGIAYNTFHTTALCSPTRASLLTGRSQHNVHSGTTTQRALDWDGYMGSIPKTTATLPEVLREYGYKTAAFGKWHNTLANETTAMGPFDRWPTGHGFDYFYGFNAGETSQYEPRLYENTTPIEPPHEFPDGSPYHLSEDMANQAVTWLRQRQAYSPDKPFFIYWAPGAAHGPHHIFGDLADKYKGTFDDGWDALRARTFERQKKLDWLPLADDAVDTRRPEEMTAWTEITDDDEKAFQIRLMELYAAFVEDVDTQAGKIIDELEAEDIRDNTLIFYVWGDNGASADGRDGSISELLAQNQIPNTVAEQLEALSEQFGTEEDPSGLSALGTAKTDNMYNAAWAWAGDAPFRYTKMIASHFGGTRNPLVISWPKKITPDPTPRSQFHHVNDIAPTIYEILDITPPEEFYGVFQDPIDGVSMKYSFEDANAPGKKKIQYFENNGSRGIYFDDWYACTFGPLIPWETASSTDLANWDSREDVWELYDLTTDFTQQNDLAKEEPEILEMMKQLFLQEAEENKVFPIGGGLETSINPDARLENPYTSWTFNTSTTRMPEFTAPGLGRESNTVTIDVDLKGDDSGVLYALGGSSGGLTLFMEDGKLKYEYNMMLLERYKTEPIAIASGHHTIQVQTTIKLSESADPENPDLEDIFADVEILVDGDEEGSIKVDRIVPSAFTASETFDVGTDLGSPVSLDYADNVPFPFTGTINTVKVGLVNSMELYLLPLPSPSFD
ncbi:arylsulfatase [Okeania sp. SIO2B3]|uniref:arylsulfatase n=1 Tax=Okeania sp. SIO2B3 TaxID=2607784 RepID=UPI0013C0A467|nr:arylsulfatase [Okeania sp. SIO2B3]NET42868.1 arylsulfatase [Okeania sp. SIO2B3]